MIEVQNLTKRYGDFKAVDDVSFSVGTEQVLGFLGPNGAGKTTIMKILTGFHFPTDGTAFIGGVSVQEDPVSVKKQIGYLPEGVPLYGELTVDEYLNFIAAAREIPVKQRKSKINEALEACGLKAKRSNKIETLSKGYKQRTGLAQAIIHDPQILILDEPTTGLDPNQIIEIRKLITELGRSKTVILSTHILQEVEAVCSNVLILNEGRIAAQGTPEAIAATMKGGENWDVRLKGASLDEIRSKLEKFSAAVFEGALKINALEEKREGLVSAAFFIPSQTKAGETETGERIFDWAISHNLKILRMDRKKLSLEDIFVRLTK
ncbi:MAG: ATP-binding cassette domain-containing protein [Spirochaetaceae bacterium]|jgi:ABC-2 type transport system ATP-binding protein|nr:ATP-binding cassette domain-containing protein [Spirochaetaceae bacterium]